MKRAVRELFAIDSRSLAVFRIAVSIVLLVDLGIRVADLDVMYTDDGMFSRTFICRHYSIWNWSFHLGGGSTWYQAALFGFAALCALAMLAGFETRLATVASWLMLVSLHNRVPLVLTGADNYVRMLLFWGMFLPLGSVWSIDAWSARRRGAGRARAERVLSVASAAILLQVAFVYFFSAIFKSQGDWIHGRALAAILPDGFFGKPIASRILEYPSVLAVLTVGVFAVEWIAPFLLFSPKWTVGLRLSVIAFLASLHVGIEILLDIGLFSFVSISALILFLPSSFWEKLLHRSGITTGDSGRREHGQGIAPRHAMRPSSLAAEGACALALAYVVFANLNGLPDHLLPWTRMPKTELLTVSLGLGQQWDMFSAAPPRNGWCVARATLKDGTHVDLLRGGAPVDWERPRHPAAVYPNHRWLKLFREMSIAEREGSELIRRPVAEYLCRRWNQDRMAEKRVADFVLVFCTRRESPHGIDLGPSTVRDTLLHLDLDARNGQP